MRHGYRDWHLISIILFLLFVTLSHPEGIAAPYTARPTGGTLTPISLPTLSGGAYIITTLYSNSADTVILTASRGHVLTTHNGGTNWSVTVPLDGSTEFEDVTFISATTGYLAGSRSRFNNNIVIGKSPVLLRTTDAGLSWQDVSTSITGNGYTQGKLEEVEFPTPAEGYVTFRQDDSNSIYLLRTANSARSWSFVPDFPARIIDLCAPETGTCFAITSDSKVHKGSNITDASATWEILSIASGGAALSPSDIFMSNASRGVLLDWDGSIYLYNDLYSWQDRSPAGATLPVLDVDLEGKEGLIAGRYGTLLHSTNSGVDWTVVAHNEGDDGSTFEKVELIRSGGGWIAGNTGTVGSSLESHLYRWQPEDGSQPGNLGDDVYAVHAADPTTVWAVGADGFIAQTSMTANSWSLARTDVNHQFRDVVCSSATTVFMAGHTFENDNWPSKPANTPVSLLLYSTNGGQTFTGEIGGETEAYSIEGLALDAYGGLWAVTDGGHIMKRDDPLQDTWTVIQNTTALNDITFQGAKGCAVGNNGLIWTTQDDGTTWQQQTSGTTQHLLSVDYSGSWQHLAASTQQGSVLTSMDGGTTWSTTAVASTSLNSIGTLSLLSLALGDNGKIYYSNDYEATWSAADTTFSDPLNDIHLLPIDNGDALAFWLVGDNGILLSSENILGPTPISADPITATAEWGPPATTNEWHHFSVPLTATNFSLTDAEFAQLMSNVTRIRIRTELRNGNDIGNLDQIALGSARSSAFQSGDEGWTAAGDGTMSWVADGGTDGNGYIQVQDWASGDWHYAVAPPSWAGNFTAQIGQSIEFNFRTDHLTSGYKGLVELTSEPINRLLMAPQSWTLAPGESTTLTLRITQPVDSDLRISLSSSSSSCIEVPSTVTIPAGQSTAQVQATAPAAASEGCTSTLTASASGFPDARITLTVAESSTPDSPWIVRIHRLDNKHYPNLRCFVSVTDTLNNPYPSLSSSTITVLENGQPFSPTLTPIHPDHGETLELILTVDLSESMADPVNALSTLLPSLDQALLQIYKDVHYRVIAFRQEIESMLPLTGDPLEVRAFLSGLSFQGTPGSAERILDVLTEGYLQGFWDESQKRILLASPSSDDLLSSSLQNYTKDLVNIFSREHIAVDCWTPNLYSYHYLAKETGGMFFPLTQSADTVAEEALAVLGSQQVFDFYTTSSTQPDGSMQTVTVEIDIDGTPVRVQTGYIATPATVAIDPYQIMAIPGERFDVDVKVRSMTDLGLVHFYLLYDPAKLRVVHLAIDANTNFLAQGDGDSNWLTQNEVDQNRIDYTHTRINSAQGASGSGTLCTITFEPLVDDCSGALEFATQDFRFDRLDGTPLTVTAQGAVIQSAVQNGNSVLLGDFDSDLDIDTRDYSLLSTYWKPANGANGDIGPAAGQPPLLDPAPDGVVNFEDMFIFTRMWNWFHGAWTPSMSGQGAVRKTNGKQGDWQIQSTPGGTHQWETTLRVTDIRNLAMGHLVIDSADPSVRIDSVRQGELLSAVGSGMMFLSEAEGASREITFSHLASATERVGVHGSGTLMTVYSTGPDADAIRLSELDLRTADNRRLLYHVDRTHQTPSVALPETVQLQDNYPNPFNGTTTIPVQLPEETPLRLTICNTLGQIVRTLVDDRLSAGAHTFRWNGLSDRGEAVTSGVYFIHLDTPTEHQTQSILYVK